ncbi:hypothetical protein KKC13_01920 [bacterium]|nr:hypothetical protein [bacterium]MBU1957633.1 hypothetical protein [bacterium]
MRVLLNGVGRIGKAILRITLANKVFDIVAINELNPNIESIAYSINYDSTYGAMNDKFVASGDCIENSTSKIAIFNHGSLQEINLQNIDIIIDASGSKVDIKALKQLPVKAIFLTHPNKDADINVILGVNEKSLNLNVHKVISTSSCNATALLPVLKLIDDHKTIACGDIVTIHPLLNHQRVLDSGCIGSQNRGVACNLEFGRSATQNIIPSQTTTIEACSYVMKSIHSKFISSSSLRVPTNTVGAISVTLFLKNPCTKEEIINLCQAYEKDQKFDILLNNHEPLVSSDFQAQRYTTIVDHRFTDVKAEKMLKLLIWYDNEWGYASKVADIVQKIFNIRRES